MEDPTEAADPSAPTFSQVVFMDIPKSYPPSTPVTCSYTFAAAFQPNPRDWVGIFKVGWTTAKEYHTFVWVEPCHDIVGQETLTRQALFKEYYLPKDEIEFYQFCYVDNTGQVRGASTPFCFRNPAEQSLESSPEDDLLVITTQEQVEQSLREKAEMEKELDQIKAENETLKGALQREYQQAASLKGQNDQKEKERAELVNELHQTKQQNENLRRDLQEQLKETKRLKEELSLQLTKQMEIQQGSITEKRERSLSRSSEEKYDRAVMKINQLKEERDKLKEGIDAQSEELSKVAAKVRERERELFNAKDRIQLIQVDLQSSEKEKERLAAELRRLQSLTNDMDKVQKANQELCRKLSVHETQPSPPHDLKGQCETLRRELQETKAKLAAEKEENKNSKSRSEYLNRELQQVREQLENMIMSLDDEKRKSSKFELQISEMTEMMADNNILLEDKEKQVQLMRREKEELVREIQSLNDDIKGLRQLYSEPPASPVDSMRLQSANSPPSADNSNTSLQQEHVYETIEIQEEEVLVCRHCQESFPGITREELEQHEQSHRVCPFCTIICDNMEQSLFEDHVYSH